MGRACEVTLPPMQVHQTPTLLLTRPRALSEEFAADLTGADVVIAPLMEIVATGAAVQMDGVKGLIFTSQNAVPFAPACGLPAYCVGPRTAQIAQAAGFQVQVVERDADALVQALKDHPPQGSLLHIHGTHVRGDIAARLTAAGTQTNGVAAYDQKPCAPDTAFRTALTRAPLIVPLFSPRSAALFAQAAPIVTATTQIIALSHAVVDALPVNLRVQTQVLSAPNGVEMARAMEPFGVKRNCP